MRLTADGTTPISRSVLVNDFETDDGYAFALASPLLLAAGDRVALGRDGVAVTRADGERLVPAGTWSTRCSLGARKYFGRGAGKQVWGADEGAGGR
ncbi:hypothetical protein ACIGW0_27495 [Streptomyces bikiniensis]|uniref:Uncharacterized protein n=1 Tax=Streptomyces bikiniensis TaxID=1896 RepID=A0ABW8D2Y8_STRBI